MMCERCQGARWICERLLIARGHMTSVQALGKRLVIEYASMEAALPVGQTVRMSIQILKGNPPGIDWVSHSLPMSAPALAGFFTGDHYTSVGQMVRAYADEGNIVRIVAQRNDGTGGSASATFAIAGTRSTSERRHDPAPALHHLW